MALHADVIWEVRTAGDDGNGGGFKEGASGTDYSQQTSAQATLTTASTVHTTTTQLNVDAGDYTVAAGDVGNILQITGGTATAGWYEITAVDVGNNRWTVDRSAGTSAQTVSGKMGGALGSPGCLTELPLTSGHIAYIKSGTYTITTSTDGKSGPFDQNVNNANTRFRVEGYDTTRGDMGGDRISPTRPVLSAGTVGSVTLWGPDGDIDDGNCTLIAVEANGQSQTSITGFASGGRYGNPTIIRCKASNCTTYGFALSGDNGCRAHECEADGCEIGFYGALTTTYCWAHHCTTTGFSGGSHYHCISSENGTSGFSGNGLSQSYVNCTSYNNTDDGFNNTTWAGVQMIGCLAVNNGGYGFGGTNKKDVFIWDCSFYNNTSGSIEYAQGIQETISITGDPFVNAPADDYSLNNTTGAGAELRGILGIPAMPVRLDVGGDQHADPAGGVSPAPYVIQGIGTY